MTDPFVPEGDALDQQREVSDRSEPLPDDDERTKRALRYPRERPMEAPEADVLEQSQVVEDDDDRR